MAHRIAIVLVLLLAAGLRLHGIARESLWFDEAATAHIVGLPPAAMLERIKSDERTPPLHYFLLHVWTRVFGDSETSLRLPSAIAGTAAVWVLYLLVRRLFGPTEGLVAALMLGLSRYQILYSQEARAYSLMLLLGLWSCELFVRLMRSTTRRGEVAYVIVTALLLYSHLYGVFAILAQHVAYAVCLWSPLPLRERVRVRGERGESLGEVAPGGVQTLSPSPPPSPSRGEGVSLSPGRWLLLNLAVLALFAPWIPTSVAWTRSVGTAFFWVKPITLAEVARAYRLYTGSWAMLAVLVAFAALGIWRRRDRLALALLGALATLPVVVPVIASVLGKPTFADRYGIIAPAGLYGLAAAGVVALRWEFARAAALILIGLLSLAGHAAEWDKPDWRGAGDYLTTHMRPGDVAVINRKIGTYLYDYYVHRPDVRRIGFDGEAIPLTLPLDEPGRRVWLVVHSEFVTPQQILARAPWQVLARRRFGHGDQTVEVLELTDATPVLPPPAASPPPSSATLPTTRSP